MGKVTIITCDIADLQEALAQLQKGPIVVAPTTLAPGMSCSEKCAQKYYDSFNKKPHKAPLTDAQKKEILELHNAGESNKEIAEALGVCRNQVKNFVYRTKQKGKEHPPPAKMSFLTAMDYVKLGIKDGQSYLNIADQINRNVGGHWTGNDVAKAIKEMNGKC